MIQDRDLGDENDLRDVYRRCSFAEDSNAPNMVVLNGAILNQLTNSTKFLEHEAYLVSSNGIELMVEPR